MRNFIKTIGFIFLGFIACGKENNDIPNQDTTKYVIAGFYDTSYIYKQFQPEFFVTLNRVSCLDMWGNDSLDINMDGIYDLIFKIADINESSDENCFPESEDSTIVVDYWPAFYPFFSITLRDSFEILNHTTVDEYWSYPTSFIDTLNSRDTINLRQNWKSDQVLYFYNYNKPETGGYGDWINLNSTKYLGFRFSKNGVKKYGWIKIEKDDNFVFRELAYEK